MKDIDNMSFLKVKTENDLFDALYDAHTIFVPEYFVKFGYKKDFVDACITTFKSDTRDHKSTIYGNDGDVIEKLEGVMADCILSRTLDVLGVDDSECNVFYGRGKTQQCKINILYKAIAEKL